MKLLYISFLACWCWSFATYAQTERGTLVSVTWVRDFTTADIAAAYNDLGIPAALLPIHYDVGAYKLIYHTIDVHGLPTIASGIVMLPLNPDPSPCGAAILSYQHGTIAVKEQVPSRLSEEAFIAVGAATDGYVACVADYLGLGDSPGLHPYIHARSEATAVIDMLRATRHYCSNNNVMLNGQLFLTGYSQGGHATMATHRAIETEYANEFEVTAAAPMSGPYDVGGVQTDLLTAAQPYPEPNYLPYVVLSYHQAYDYLAAAYPSLSDIFIPPYDTLMPQLFDGTHGSGEINEVMPGGSGNQVPADIVRPEVFADFQTNPDHPLRIALADNNTYINWTPQAPIKMHFCSSDRSVIYLNAYVAYNHFASIGVTNIDTLNVSPGLDHYPCAQPSILFAKIWFDQQRVGCVGIDDHAHAMAYMRLLPNPATSNSDFVMLHFANPNSEPHSVYVSDLMGKTVLSLHHIVDEQVPISTRQLSAGMYVVSLKNGQASQQQKLMVVR